MDHTHSSGRLVPTPGEPTAGSELANTPDMDTSPLAETVVVISSETPEESPVDEKDITVGLQQLDGGLTLPDGGMQRPVSARLRFVERTVSETPRDSIDLDVENAGDERISFSDMSYSGSRHALKKDFVATSANHADKYAHHHERKISTFSLSLAALGVVFGDIGTSPLYALRESFHGTHAIPITEANVLGVLSLIAWSLLIVISIKYLFYILWMDNEGEGGVLPLMDLVTRIFNKKWIVALGIFGTCLIFGDGIITPAISVLSAFEGLELVTDSLTYFVIPITCIVLTALFLIQSKGTQKIGKLYGPVVLVWFLSLAAAGLNALWGQWDVFQALNPWHALDYFLRNGFGGTKVLGSVFLVVTGGEALFCDLGHFGRNPIRLAWFFVVFPGLILNYFGQGAALISRPEVVSTNPFYLILPSWAVLPMVILAAFATIIASQAVISGTFSLVNVAIQNHFFPPIRVTHTADDVMGQIYVPGANWALYAGVLCLVFLFRTSSNLAGAYGFAVATTMLIEEILALLNVWKNWGVNLFVAILLTAIFFLIDLSFFLENLTKLLDGGWLPLTVAIVIYIFMKTYFTGSFIVAKNEIEHPEVDRHITEILKEIRSKDVVRAPGVAIYAAPDPFVTPERFLVHNYDQMNTLHERVLLLRVEQAHVHHIASDERLTVVERAGNIAEVNLKLGYRENIEPAMLCTQRCLGGFEISDCHFYMCTEELAPVACENKNFAPWKKRLFSFMARNTNTITGFWTVPWDQTTGVSKIINI